MNGQTTKVLKRVFLSAIAEHKNVKVTKYAWKQFKKFYLKLSHTHRSKLLKPFYNRQSKVKINIATGNSITYID